jgi:heptosyltransferase-2/heptosyltransferase-3
MHYGQEFFRLLPKGCTGQVPVPELAWPETAGSRAAALLGGCGVYGGPYAVVAVGAAGGAKRYPPSAWRAVVRRLCTRLPVVVVGTESEVPLASAAGAGEERGVHNLCGATGLPELAALLAGAAGFVGVDSGAAHLAAAVGCPVVVLFGPGDPLETAPAGKDVRILRDGLWCSPCRSRTCLRPLHASECMDRIAPERVAFTLLAALRPVAR